MALPTSTWSVDEASLTRFTKSLQRPADDRDWFDLRRARAARVDLVH